MGVIDQIALEDEDTFSDDDEPEPVRMEGVPFVTVDKDRRDNLRRPWRYSIIVKKLLGKSLTFKVFHQRLIKVWGLKDDQEIIDLSHGYYIVKLQSRETCARILSGGLAFVTG